MRSLQFLNLLFLAFSLLLSGLITGFSAPQTPSEIQEIVDSAEPNSVIRVGPGVYVGPLKIRKPLVLIAEEGAVIDGRGIGDVVVIESENVWFEGFKVVNSFQDVAFEPAGIKVANSRNVTVVRVSTERVVHSVYVVNSTDVKVLWNSLKSLPDRSVNDRGHGVYLWYSMRVEVVGNEIAYVKDGIYTDHSYDVRLEGNAVSHSRYGIHLMYSRDHVIERNELRHNLVGMAPMYSCGVQIRGNAITENRGLAVSEGIFLRESCDVVIEYNRIVGNGVGLNLVNSPFPREGSVVVRRNVIAFNNIGIRFEIWTSAVFEGNDLVENAQQISALTQASGLWRGNFWSDRGLQLGERYLVVSSLEDLLDRWPELWAFAYGPGYVALKFARVVTDLRPTVKAIEESPSQAPNVLGVTGVQDGSSLWILAASALTLLPLVAVVIANRR